MRKSPFLQRNFRGDAPELDGPRPVMARSHAGCRGGLGPAVMAWAAVAWPALAGIAGWPGVGDAAASESFTVVVLPDTQYYTQIETNNDLYFKGQTNWIAAHKAAKNIAFVLHLGDIQNDGNPYYARKDDIYEPDFTRPTGLVPDDAQFRRADAALDILDAAGVPYSLLAGNHDFVDHTIKDEPIYYLKWFGPQRYAGMPTFGGASPATPTMKWAGMNTWHTFEAGGYRFLNLALQFAADEHDLAWAQSVVNDNPGIPTILTTHAMLNTTGYQEAYRSINDRFVRNNPQVVMTLNGHINGTYRQTETNIAGHPVQQMLVDYQSTVLPGAAFKGGGYLRTMEFDTAAKAVHVQSYSPVAEAFLTDAANQFTLPLDLSRFGRADVPGVRFTTSFQQGVGGYTGTRDTYLSAAESITSNATSSGLWVDGDASDAAGSQPRQALLRFDGIFSATGIPSDAVIESAALVVRTGTTPQSHSADSMSMHRMLGPWADSGTWLTLGPIAADGAEAILGGNANFVPVVNGGSLSFDVTESLFAWQQGAANHGWAFLPGGTDGWRFESAEAPRIDDRPALRVSYVVPAAAGVVVLDVASGTTTQAAVGCPEVVGPATLTKQGRGTVILDAVNSHTGPTIVDSGTLVVAAADSLVRSPLVIRPAATVAVAAGLTLRTPGVTVAGGRLDIGSGRIEIAPGGATEAQLRAAVVAGHGGGPAASGIVTSAGPAGAATGPLVGYQVFADGSAVVAWAAAGDTNLDRTIDILDAANIGAGGRFDTGLPASWSQGDFGYDGVVDILDVADLLAAGLFDTGRYDRLAAAGQAAPATVSAVPEPAVSGLAVWLAGVAAMAGAPSRRQSGLRRRSR